MKVVVPPLMEFVLWWFVFWFVLLATSAANHDGWHRVEWLTDRIAVVSFCMLLAWPILAIAAYVLTYLGGAVQ